MKYWSLLWLLLPTAVLARTESLPELYNRGVAAYRSNDFAQAATLFESATATADRTLQQRAVYNLGNASYRLGSAQPPQAQQLWQRAIKSYEKALALDPADADAKFNRDLVEQKLKELPKQPQQQPPQDKSDKKQDQSPDQKQQQQQQKPPPDQQQQQQKQAEQQNQAQAEKQPSQQAQKQPPDQQTQPQPQPGQTNNLEQAQAAALLDRLREDEQNWNFFPEVQMKDLKDSGEPDKDW